MPVEPTKLPKESRRFEQTPVALPVIDQMQTRLNTGTSLLLGEQFQLLAQLRELSLRERELSSANALMNAEIIALRNLVHWLTVPGAPADPIIPPTVRERLNKKFAKQNDDHQG